MPGVPSTTDDVKDLSFYIKCSIAGALACGLTHTAVTPLDLIKCRRQVDANLYKSFGDAFTKIRKAEGFGGLFLGWGPTFVGYNFQGIGKFGFYEGFKVLYPTIFGQDFYHNNKALVWAMSSASAEVFADIFLCPFEATKVRMQTSLPGKFPTTFGAALAKINADEGLNGFFKGIGPLWGRQIPYTVVKFVFFEKVAALCYKHIWTKPRESYGKGTQLQVTFISGYTAGILCAVVSHPADTLVSKLNNIQSNESLSTNVRKIYAEIGMAGLWRGLGVRIFMIGTLTGLQWWIYDTIKTLAGLQTSGGK